MFRTLAMEMKQLGFKGYQTRGYYHLYVVDISEAVMLVVEGVYDKREGRFYYDFYKYIYAKGVKVYEKTYCEQARINQMLKRVKRQMSFYQRLKQKEQM